jgi:hypothetical protein
MRGGRPERRHLEMLGTTWLLRLGDLVTAHGRCLALEMDKWQECVSDRHGRLLHQSQQATLAIDRRDRSVMEAATITSGRRPPHAAATGHMQPSILVRRVPAK